MELVVVLQVGLQVAQLEGLWKEPLEVIVIGLEMTLQLERQNWFLGATLGWEEQLVDQ